MDQDKQFEYISVLGDTPMKIVYKFNMNFKAFKRLNNLEMEPRHPLNPGTKLKIIRMAGARTSEDLSDDLSWLTLRENMIAQSDKNKGKDVN